MAKRMAVVGAGAIGASLGACLLRAGHDVTLIDQWAEHVEAMRRRGLRLTDPNEEFVVRANALHISDVSSIREEFDIVYLCVKSYDTCWSTHLIEPFLKQTGFILPVQNSLNDELVAHIVGFNRTVGCVTTIDVAVYEPAHVIRSDGENDECFIVGELSGLLSHRVQETVELLTETFGPSKATTNIWGVRWSKLVYNSMNNALSGILGPAIYSLDPKQWDTSLLVRLAIIRESVRVAQRHGIILEPIVGIPMRDFVEATSAGKTELLKRELASKLKARYFAGSEKKLGVPNRPSLLQDVMKGRKTEVDYLNGFVVCRGREVGVRTPMNQAILDIMRKIEFGKLRPDVSNLRLLEPYLKFEELSSQSGAKARQEHARDDRFNDVDSSGMLFTDA